MLSRIAESLYWLGRHVERADCTARILDAYVHLMNSGTWRADHQVIRALVHSMGLSGNSSLNDADPGRLIRTLVFSTDGSASVSGALAAARENARGVRDTLPQDVWQCLNVTWHGLRSRSATGGLHAYLRWVSERCAMTAGLVDEVMSHDEGWQFLVLGRSLERADLTVRLLAAAELPAGAAPPWQAMVSACGGWEPYVRVHGSGIGHRTATEFILLDRHFPRSVLRALTAAEGCLNELGPWGSLRGRDPASPRRILGRARSSLDYRAGTDLTADLPAVLSGLQGSVAEAHQAIGSTFFRRADEVTWAMIGNGPEAAS